MVAEADAAILMIEDNPDHAELALRALKVHKLANRVLVLGDGAQALDYPFSNGEYASRLAGNPKVVLLDLNLPKVHGLEVLRRMKADERMKMIPVVVLTSSKEESDRIDSYRLGVNSYIVKPLDFAQFVKSVGDIGLYWLLLNEPPE
ncbi:MAG: response regulator [Actinomycetota bacterium]